jgi:modification methylase
MSITKQHLLKDNSLESKQITTDTLGEGKLIEGDTLNVLKKIDDDVVNVGITSPPYNKQEKQKGWLVKNVVYDVYKDAVPEPEYQQHQGNVLNEIYRVTAPGGSFFYNHKVRWDRGNMYHPIDWLRKTEWTVKQEIIWDRVIAANIRGWRFWQVEERVYWLYKPIGNYLIGKELKSSDAKLTSIWRGVPEDGRKNPHPAPFPLWLPARVIISILGTETQGIVLDPYIGSGTAAVAAKLLGHKYIGVDRSEAYVEMTSNRLNNAFNEMPKIHEELALHNVETTAQKRRSQGKNMGKYRKIDNAAEKDEEQQNFLFESANDTELSK